MTNKQLAGARKAMNRYPDMVFRIVPGGVRVGSETVEVGQHMTEADVFQACRNAAVRQS